MPERKASFSAALLTMEPDKQDAPESTSTTPPSEQSHTLVNAEKETAAQPSGRALTGLKVYYSDGSSCYQET